MARTILVVPCFDEERRLDAPAFLDFARAHPEVALVFVDDGSTDGTPGMLERLRAAMPDAIRVERLARNSGKAEAVRSGIRVALAQGCARVGYWDADLSTPLESLDALEAVLDAHPEVEIVMGARVALLGRSIQRSALRHYLGRAFATVVSLLLRLRVYDTQCGAKLLRVTPDVRALFERPFLSRWIFDVEILARHAAAKERAGADPSRSIHELPLARWHEVGASKLRARDFARALVDLLRIRRERG